MKKLLLSGLLALVACMGAKATEYDLDISSLSGNTYNSSTHEFTFGTSWTENQWWIGDSNPLDISSYGEFIVEYTGATAASKFRVYLEPVSGTTQTVYPIANTSFGRSVFKLASGLNNIKKIVISDAGTAFNMTLTRAYFRSKSSGSATTLWTGTHALGNWADITALTSDGDGKTALKSAKVDDVIRVTFTNAVSDNQINVRNSSYTDLIDGTFSGFTVQDDAQTAEYVIPNAEVLESIQLNGIIVSGKNATVTKIELLTYTESYDAVPATIGEDGIATFSSSKHLSFAEAGITPYYASEINGDKVTLTSVDNKTTWGYQGYVLRGKEGSYDIPVIEESEAAYPSGTNHLKATSDYAADLPRSEEAGKYLYIFAKNNNGSDIGFYHLGGTYKLAAHRAYLCTDTDVTPTAGARVSLLFSDDETTAVQTIEAIERPQSDKIYNISGQQVVKPTRGFYIINGKKVIIK